jgi:hypothetical protein
MVEAKMESYLRRCYYDYDNSELLYGKNDGSFIASIPDWLVPVLQLYIDDKKVFPVITPGNHRWSFPIKCSEQPILPLADLRIPGFELTYGVINLYRLKRNAKEWIPPLSRLKHWEVIQRCICLQSHDGWRSWNEEHYDQNKADWTELARSRGWLDQPMNNYEPDFEELDDDYWIERAYTIHDRYKSKSTDRPQDPLHYDPIYSAFRSKKEITKMGIKDVDHDLYKKVPKISKLSRKAKTESADKSMRFICDQLGCTFKELNNSTILKREFRELWEVKHHQELSKQNLNARIKRYLGISKSLLIDSKMKIVYNEEIEKSSLAST